MNFIIGAVAALGPFVTDLGRTGVEGVAPFDVGLVKLAIAGNPLLTENNVVKENNWIIIAYNIVCIKKVF